jgi:hypothetical protein
MATVLVSVAGVVFIPSLRFFLALAAPSPRVPATAFTLGELAGVSVFAGALAVGGFRLLGDITKSAARSKT